ncbi:MAG: ABC transporter permease [Collinsella sp.]
MFNTIITTVKTLLRRPSTWVWGALFPIALSTMFMFMFANLSSDGTVDPVPVAVIADEAWDASTFKDVATSLAKESDNQLLEIHERDDAADANRALKAGEVAGTYTVDDTQAAHPSSLPRQSYDSLARIIGARRSAGILETVKSEARIHKMPSSCPRLPRTTRRHSPTPRRLRAPCRSRAAPVA